MYTNHRIFDWSSQEAFARMSRDYNPVHMDTLQARRTHAGAPIVHGIHSLIWILDCFARSEYRHDVRSLKVRFLQPIYVGDEVTVEITSTEAKVARARVLAGAEELVVVSLGTQDMKTPGLGTLPAPAAVPAPEKPRDLTLEDMEGMSGCLSFGATMSDLQIAFPAACSAFGMECIAALAASSTVVGMVVPGLHSLYSGLEVSLAEDPAAPAGAVEFAVLSITKRFRLVRIGIRGRTLAGSLETMSRMPPVKQPGVDSLLPLVTAGEFRDSTALVVGGSRGLGELTAKLLGAGGADVLLTYASGRNDADSVVAELHGAGAKCAAFEYDARRPAKDQLASLAAKPTHLFFFATPVIFRRKAGLFDAARFEDFNQFYISGFFDLVQACALLNPAGLKVFYPSSVFVEARPGKMTEYAMAKSAAEILCADMSRFMPGVDVFAPRLPRLPTDQTNSVVQSDTASAAGILLPLLREMFQQPGLRAKTTS